MTTNKVHQQIETPAPLVVAEKTGNALQVSALDREASARGLKVGMTLAHARAMLPALDVARGDADADRRTLDRIADWCERFTPFVALEPPRAALLDIAGAAHLFGGEAAMLTKVCAGLKAQGFAVRGAIASSPAAARALARYADGAVAAPGEDAAALAHLPVEALNLDPAAIHALRRAGLKTIGAAASRGRAELTARFGAELVFLLDEALGKAERPVTPRRPLPGFSAERRFAEPIVTEDAVAAALQDLTGALAKQMERQGRGARRIEARFFRADGAVRAISVETGGPVRDPSVIKRLFKEKLDALADPLDPGFGYDLLRLSATRTERAEAEAADFDAAAHAAREMRFLVDRLAARFGRPRVLAFEPRATHIPGRAFAAVPAQDAKTSAHTWERMCGAREAPRRPLRLFARPEPVEATAPVPDEPPVQFRWRRVLHMVARAEGPERIAPEWWRHPGAAPGPTRDYFRVEDCEGRRFWLYREGLYGRETALPRWFVHGLFA